MSLLSVYMCVREAIFHKLRSTVDKCVVLLTPRQLRAKQTIPCSSSSSVWDNLGARPRSVSSLTIRSRQGLRGARRAIARGRAAGAASRVASRCGVRCVSVRRGAARCVRCGLVTASHCSSCCSSTHGRESWPAARAPSRQVPILFPLFNQVNDIFVHSDSLGLNTLSFVCVPPAFPQSVTRAISVSPGTYTVCVVPCMMFLWSSHHHTLPDQTTEVPWI